MEHEGIGYCYLDGRTRRRDRVLERFKDGPDPVFLISPKAGGLGLNLTEADYYCFLLGPWWNPATEAQAIDRTHRIGQTRPVMVYRMIAHDTIEEKVVALARRKAAVQRSHGRRRPIRQQPHRGGHTRAGRLTEPAPGTMSRSSASRERPGATPLLHRDRCRQNAADTRSPRRHPCKRLLDELRSELGTDRVELVELVVLGAGAGATLAAIRAERDGDAALRRRLADRVRSRTLPFADAADRVRRTGWARG